MKLNYNGIICTTMVVNFVAQVFENQRDQFYTKKQRVYDDI